MFKPLPPEQYAPPPVTLKTEGEGSIETETDSDICEEQRVVMFIAVTVYSPCSV